MRRGNLNDGAASAFLAALTAEQRTATLFAVDDDEWRRWTNVHAGSRQGASLREMNEAQREAAMGLLEASLSAKGLETADGIIKLNHTEGELMDNFEEFDEDLYWFTIMGEPSETESWGWQLDGHHLVITYFVLGDQVIMAPVFPGSEPTIAPEGTDYAALSVQLAEQQAVAILGTEKRGTPTPRVTFVPEGAETMTNRPSEFDGIVKDGQGPGTSTRRDVIKAGAGAAALAVGGTGLRTAIVRAQDATPSALKATPTECVLTPGLTEGPYYLDGQLVRRDITEGKPGVPLGLRIAVQDITNCTPLADAAVEVWHCDAQGYYSGIVGENPGGGGATTGDENAATAFLRGIQLTDADGTVEFTTIYPGWYTSRTVHIHMKVHVEGAAGDAASDADAVATPEGGQTYQGGHTSHTGQLFFDDAISEEIFATEAYDRSSVEGKIGNDEDNIFGEHGDEPGFLLDLTGSVDEGFVGAIIVGVDPTAVAAEGGMEGGAGGRPGGTPPGGPGGPP
ncbi:MAG: DUF3500 domain-containing protein, partial [Thermomicrobiales bacterium]